MVGTIHFKKSTGIPFSRNWAIKNFDQYRSGFVRKQFLSHLSQALLAIIIIRGLAQDRMQMNAQVKQGRG